MRTILNVLTGCWLLGTAAVSLGSPSAAEVDIKLSTNGNDIAFSQAAIQVPFGKKVRIRFANRASKDSEILHNVAVLQPGTTDSVIKALQANGYDLEKIRSDKSVIAMTKALPPGSEDVLEFTPAAPGLYPYICLMAGHADMLGMKGLLNVKK